MNIGFTGTQHTMTDYQQAQLRAILKRLPPHEFHHGDCVGADATAHRIVAETVKGVIVHVHPPVDPKKRARVRMPLPDADWAMLIREPLPYMERNYNIVKETHVLIACPATGVEVLRSGTWSTIRFARKLNRPIMIIGPSCITYEGDDWPS